MMRWDKQGKCEISIDRSLSDIVSISNIFINSLDCETITVRELQDKNKAHNNCDVSIPTTSSSFRPVFFDICYCSENIF